MSRRSSLLVTAGSLLVLVSLYTFGGVIQAASLFMGVKALRNANLWGSLSLISLTLAVGCFLSVRKSSAPTSPLTRAVCSCVAFGLAAWLLWPLVSDLLAADRCLDQGGSFNYVESACDMANSQPYVSLLDRQGFRVVGALVFGILAVIALRSNFSSSRRDSAHRASWRGSTWR